ncbi:MAG: hypothetical protein AUJ01_14070 [Acidobacteria bacterium 13_1_40CM_3_65_5]|nr:MAG: hypothetical protein AUH41_06605 [Gemmatimonadetes bacterium 13_1_40CM_66_11]OLD14270.1 MAG: hypothetical protein AUJ01_14070 [Acidobacteria bacterium 13_1_40CM_3_65_5]
MVVHGVTGGLLAGLVVALWFLVADTLAGHPFRTPTLLAGVLLNREFSEVTFRLVTAYTVLHFGVFAILGVVMAWISAAFTAPPRVLLGLVFGLLLQEVTFYVGLLLLHAPHLGVVPWPHVVGANIAAGLVLMTYLHYAERDPRPLGLSALRNHPVLARGVVNGLIGAAVVAVWFFVLDLASGTPLRTPAALGSALLLGAAGPGEIVATFGLVAAYTVVHIAAFVIAGVVFVALAEHVERVPAMALLVLLTAILFEGLILATIGVGAQWVLGTVGWWSVAVANLLAVLAMGWQVWRTHPLLQRRLLEHPQLRV